MAVGEWRDDSLPVWVETGLANTRSAFQATTYVSDAYSDTTQTSYGPVMDAAWAGTGATFSGGRGGIRGPNWLGESSNPELNATYSAAVWTQTWVTVARQIEPTVDEGTVPAFDPEAIGIEWEPTSIPDSQRLVVTLGLSGFPAIVAAGEPVYVKLGQANPVGKYDPGFTTASNMRSRSTLATFDGADGEVEITTLPIDLTGPASLAVTLLDTFTHSGVYFAGSGGTQRRRLPFSLSLQASFTPRYRYIYADTGGRMPPLRQVQRPSVPRAVQNNSRQASLRSGRAFI